MKLFISVMLITSTVSFAHPIKMKYKDVQIGDREVGSYEEIIDIVTCGEQRVRVTYRSIAPEDSDYPDDLYVSTGGCHENLEVIVIDNNPIEVEDITDNDTN